MKRAIFIIVLISQLLAPPFAYSIEEKDLPSEKAPLPKLEIDPSKIDTVVYNGYINSKEVTVIANVMGVVFHLCKVSEVEFCSDEQGVLVVGAEESGPVIDLLRSLDEAITNQNMVQIYLTKDPYYGGVRRIVNAKMSY